MAMMMVLLVGVFSVMLMQTALGTALPALMTAFNVNASTVQWLTTIFLMANGIMVPVSAYLTNEGFVPLVFGTIYYRDLGGFCDAN